MGIEASAIKECMEAGRIHAAISNLVKHDIPAVVMPPGYQLVDVEKWLPKPLQKRACPTFLDASSFALYVARHKTADTHLFASLNTTSASLEAVIDYHGKEPSWCAHAPIFSTVATVEWARWIGADRKRHSQADFALFLEENAELFQSPSGAQLLEMISTLEGKSDVSFNSGLKLQSGANRLSYVEEVTVKGNSTEAGGFMELPPLLIAGIAPFVGTPAYKVSARLRYRIEGRKLTLWFETVNPHLLIRDAVKAIIEQVEEGTGIKALIGGR